MFWQTWNFIYIWSVAYILNNTHMAEIKMSKNVHGMITGSFHTMEYVEMKFLCNPSGKKIIGNYWDD